MYIEALNGIMGSPVNYLRIGAASCVFCEAEECIYKCAGLGTLIKFEDLERLSGRLLALHVVFNDPNSKTYSIEYKPTVIITDDDRIYCCEECYRKDKQI